MAKPKNGSSVGGLVFVGCIIIGLGVGILVEQAAAGVLLGVGIGFLGMAFFTYRGK